MGLHAYLSHAPTTHMSLLSLHIIENCTHIPLTRVVPPQVIEEKPQEFARIPVTRTHNSHEPLVSSGDRELHAYPSHTHTHKSYSATKVLE